MTAVCAFRTDAVEVTGEVRPITYPEQGIAAEVMNWIREEWGAEVKPRILYEEATIRNLVATVPLSAVPESPVAGG
ncbi:hypothetical protein [Streptantibioticus ferralitis]|uniref:Uncharacterized protein n=1 Tax=Streptantibioticus ferralitis TaxID=236510 RepID=A0ABT5Z247_9ACTN|nr:hypothetical protein [Streptantibioticus ferralitis]MDF2257732.1 hypothetical protein [Streptantibioticus ferralitis]